MLKKRQRARDDVRERRAGKHRKHTAQKTQARGDVLIQEVRGPNPGRLKSKKKRGGRREPAKVYASLESEVLQLLAVRVVHAGGSSCNVPVLITLQQQQGQAGLPSSQSLRARTVDSSDDMTAFLAKPRSGA